MSGVPYAEVIGDPIDHSLSPAIHGFWLERLGIGADYRRRQVSRLELPSYLEKRSGDPAWRGCNVTMPLKLDALSLADDSTDRALGASAANILAPDQGRLRAGNTDVGAVIALVRRLREAGAPKGSIALIGGGGAARAVLLALHILGIHAVRIHARDLAAGYKLAVEFGLELEPVGLDEPIEADGLVNATPLGMNGMPPLAIDWSRMSSNGWIFDLVTAPVESALIRSARERGLRTATGIEMLVEQASESFPIFFGAEAPRNADSELMTRLQP